MQKFLTDTLTGRFIKSLLYNTYLPSYRTVRENDFIISGIRYAYKEFIIEATSTGYIDPYDTSIKNIATYKIIDFYTLGDKQLKYTYNFISKTNYYDTETHIQLGNYLRVYRDLKNIDLMPFYNCYCDKYTSDFIVSTSGIQATRKQNTLYETIEIPIRYNQDYTIAIDSPSEVIICPALFKNNDLIVVDSVNISDYLWQKSGNIVKYASMQFNYPVVYNLKNTDPFLQKYEKNLYLFIQIPYGLQSSIVILEGDYTDLSRKIIGIESVQSMSNANLDNYTLTPLSLLKMNDKQRYAFSDRLIEYLYDNAIDLNDEVNGNIERVQNAMYAYKNFPVLKDVWQNELRRLIYNYYLEDSSNVYDITGYVDKDIEKYLSIPFSNRARKNKILISIQLDTSNAKMEYGVDDKIEYSGLIVNALYSDGSSQQVTSKCNFSIKDGTFLTTAGEFDVVISYQEGTTIKEATFTINVNYDSLKFYSDNYFILNTSNSSKNWDGYIEYSNDRIHWYKWTGSSIASAILNSKNVLYLRGMSNTSVTGTGDDPANYGNGFVLTGTDIYADGDIGSLLNYQKVYNDDVSSMSISERAFEKLFYNNTELIKCPTHSIMNGTTIPRYCYLSMYEGCTKLVYYPNLPATILQDSCYERMFYGCSRLRICRDNSYPRLPATRIPPNAYKQMFYNCSVLKRMPSMEIQQFADYPPDRVGGQCQEMFYGCGLLKLNIGQREDPMYSQRRFICRSAISSVNVQDMFTNTGGRWQGTPEHDSYYFNEFSEFIELRSTSSFTLSFPSTFYWGWDRLQYSYDPTGFRDIFYPSDRTITARKAGNIYRIFLRGIGSTSMCNTHVPSSGSLFTISGSNVMCLGNIESLLDYTKLESGDLIQKTPYCFNFLFANQTALISVPRFAQSRIQGYTAMFQGCVNIMLSETEDSTYKYEFRIPALGTAQGSNVGSMFASTGGSWKGTPSVNTTYYTNNPII